VTERICDKVEEGLASGMGNFQPFWTKKPLFSAYFARTSMDVSNEAAWHEVCTHVEEPNFTEEHTGVAPTARPAVVTACSGATPHKEGISWFPG
jgi:hypothetical protein